MLDTWLWYRCAQHPKNTYILTAQTPLSGNCTIFLKRTFLGHPVISTTFGIGHAFHFISHRSRSIWPLFAYRFLTWDLNFFPFHYFEFIASIKHLFIGLWTIGDMYFIWIWHKRIFLSLFFHTYESIEMGWLWVVSCKLCISAEIL